LAFYFHSERDVILIPWVALEILQLLELGLLVAWLEVKKKSLLWV